MFCLCSSTTWARTAETSAPAAAKAGTWCSLTPQTRCVKTTISSRPAASNPSARSWSWRRTTALWVRKKRSDSVRLHVTKWLHCVNNYDLCVFICVSVLSGQSVISPSVETWLSRTVKSVMSVTTTQTPAASALNSLKNASVASGLV